MIFKARIPIVILCCMLLHGCGNKKVVPGTNVSISADSLISEEKMVLILADVHVAEAAMLLERNNGLSVKDKQAFYYQGIFSKHHVSGSRYEENLTFYRQNPDNLAKMYEKVTAILENRQKTAAGKK